MSSVNLMAREVAAKIEAGDPDVGDHLGPVGVEQLTAADVPGLWPVPGPADDKYSRGVLGVIAGSARFPGAAGNMTVTVTARAAGKSVLSAGPRVSRSGCT